MDNLEELDVARELFQEIEEASDDGDDANGRANERMRRSVGRAQMRSDLSIYAPQPAATETPIRVSYPPTRAGGADEVFEDVIRSTQTALQAEVSRAVWEHPLYAFVQAVNGAMGIPTTSNTAGFDTSRMQQRVDSVLSKLRRVKVLELQWHKTKHALLDGESSSPDSYVEEAQRFEVAASRALIDWQNRLGRSHLVPYMLKFWELLVPQMRDLGSKGEELVRLFDGPDPEVDDYFAGNYPGQSQTALKSWGGAEGFLRSWSHDEVYPTIIGDWPLVRILDPKKTPRQPVRNKQLSSYLEIDPPKPQYQTDFVRNDLRRPIEFLRTPPRREDDDDDDDDDGRGNASSGVTPAPQTKTQITNLRKKLMDMRASENSSQKRPYSASIFSGWQQRATISLLLYPTIRACDVLEFLLSEDAPDRPLSFSDLNLTNYLDSIVRKIDNPQIKVDPQITAQDMVIRLREISQSFDLGGFVSRVFGGGGGSSGGQQSQLKSVKDTMQFASYAIRLEGTAGRLGQTKDAQTFLSYIATLGEDERYITRMYETTFDNVYNLSSPWLALERITQIVDLITCTKLYRQYYVDQVRQREEALESAKERVRKTRATALLREERLRDELRTISTSKDRTKREIQDALTQVVDGDSVGPTADIVQATNAAFGLVKNSLPNFAYLTHAENLALTDNEQVMAAFAELVARVRRKNQLSGPAVGYVQNAHYARAKVDMGGAMQVLAQYYPVGPINGRDGGYRFLPNRF